MLQTHCSTLGLVKAAPTVGCSQCPAGLQMLTYLNVLGTELGTEWDTSAWHQISLSLWQGPDVMAFCICRVNFAILSQPFIMRRNQCVRVHFQQQNWAIFIPFWCFQASLFPTQDHLSMCHPRNKTKGQTQRTAWIIACPQLQKHGIQLFSSHLCNRPRNTERSQKVFHCLCWQLMIRQYIWAHQTWQKKFIIILSSKT